MKHPKIRKAPKKAATVPLGSLTKDQKFKMKDLPTIYKVVIPSPSRSDTSLGSALCMNTKAYTNDFLPAGLEVIAVP